MDTLLFTIFQSAPFRVLSANPGFCGSPAVPVPPAPRILASGSFPGGGTVRGPPHSRDKSWGSASAGS